MIVPAPELIGHGGWIGAGGELSLRALRGKVVLVHFWSLSCAKCLRVMDELRDLQRRFPDEVVAVSVHSPKFPYTGHHDVVLDAVARLGIDHPVLDDPDLITWQQYGVRGWPTVVVVNPRSEVVGAVTGDGNGPLLHRVVQEQVELHRETTHVQRHRLALRPPAITMTRPPGGLAFPAKVATNRRGRIAIADSGNDRVVVADLVGEHLARITHLLTGLSRPQGVRLYGSDLVVCDTGHDRVVLVDLASRPGLDEEVEPDPAGIVRLRVRPDEIIASGLAAPADVIADVDRSFVVAESAGQRLWRIPADGSSPAVIAGDRYEGLVDGPAGDAELAQPSGLTRLADAVAFVDAESSALRLLQNRGRVGTLAGIGLFDWGLRDGRTSTARMQHPEGVVAGLDGASLYVADTYNHRLRRWRNNRLETLPVDGLLEPSGLDILPDGRLLVADRAQHRICLVDPETGTVTPLTFATVTLPDAETTPGWGPRLDAATGAELAIGFAIDLGPFELDRTAPVPVRVSLESEPPWLLDAHPGDWVHHAPTGELHLRGGTPGSGFVTVRLEARVGTEGVSGTRRSVIRHRLTVR